MFLFGSGLGAFERMTAGGLELQESEKRELMEFGEEKGC